MTDDSPWQTLRYPFEGLSDPAGGATLFGEAHVAFDGVGAWRIDAFELDAGRPGRTPLMLLRGVPRFSELIRTLVDERGEDIEARINAALQRGAHMVRHDRNMPPSALPDDGSSPV